jgi:hypothetical protein
MGASLDCRAIGAHRQLLVFLSVVGLALVFATPGLATGQNDEPAQLADFEIPDQPLAAALQRFMSASNVAIVVDGALVGIKRSSAIRGTFSPDGALQSMLEGTGLDSRRIGPGVYTLVPALPRAEARPRFLNYAAVVQRAVMEALCRVDDTNPVRYRTVIRLWLQPDGIAKRVELAVSTGSQSSDAAVTDALQHLDVGNPAPTSLPQPIKLAIAPRATGDTSCSSAPARVSSSARRGHP